MKNESERERERERELWVSATLVAIYVSHMASQLGVSQPTP